MDKQNVVQLYNGKLLSNKRQWTIDMDQLDIFLRERSHSHNVLYNSINMAFSKRQRCSDDKSSMVAGDSKLGRVELQNDSTREFSGMTEELYLDCVHGWTNLYMC